MRSLFCLATLAIAAFATDGYVQETKKTKPEITKAVYMVTGLH
jgi:hypothetical protein